ncbi:MAG: GTP 3',8-cyclase MoaA [Desulfomicrobiaceae bacterium]|nr:GTP 3',8-cyclase MoaA [Desulfomicrobiaceae bacterium]
MLMDRHGRTVSYLRLSVTDRCNLRCLYCRPAEAISFIPHERVLSYEEMVEIVAAAQELGVHKVRLTGGEPFARKDFVPFVARLHARFPKLDLRITTNATMLAGRMPELQDAGVRTLNISLDTLSPHTFAQITGVDAHRVVLAAIEEALASGIRVKINAVALRGINDTELPAFVDFARTYGVDVRFIEFMPIGYQCRWTEENFWSAEEIVAAFHAMETLRPETNTEPHSGPARMYRIIGSQGRLGVISAVSHHFCASCNRLRVTCEGRLRTCLFSDEEYDVAGVLRRPDYQRTQLLELFQRANAAKPLGYELLAARKRTNVCQRVMTTIGG